MKLTVPDTARLLSVPETTIESWVREGAIPFARVNDMVRFNRTDILEWATARGMPVSAEIFPVTGAGDNAIRLSDALEAGGVHHDVEGGDVATAWRATVERMGLADDADREAVLAILLAREALGSTGVGDGIAIPHVSNPVVLDVERASVTLCFLAQPVELGAVDQRPVTTVFALLTPTVRAHLQLLSRLSAALHHPRFRAAVTRRAPAPEILAEARRVEGVVPAEESEAEP